MRHHETQAPTSPEWYTPPEIFEALGLVFDLDPCSPVDVELDWIPARRRLTVRDDGLHAPWGGAGVRVWLNPPYGRLAGPAVLRLVEHGNGIALVYVRTETPWFQAAARAADGLCFIRGRVNIVRPPEVAGRAPDKKENRYNGTAGSVLLAYGEENAAALERSGLGLFVCGGGALGVAA